MTDKIEAVGSREMKPIAGCRIKFGPYVLDGPFHEGHAGLITKAAIHHPDDLAAARLAGDLKQGFYDADGRWVDRLSARIVAEALEQVPKDRFHHKTLLFSEDFLERP